MAHGVGEARQLLLDYHAAANAGELERMHELHEALDAANAWAIEHRIEATLDRLKLPADTLGRRALGRTAQARGARARAGAASPTCCCSTSPPTTSTSPRSSGSRRRSPRFAGSVLFVTHDRRFLDRVAQRIVELDRGRLTSYPGNFSEYEKRKAEALAIEEVRAQKFDKVLAQEEAWIRKGVRGAAHAQRGPRAPAGRRCGPSARRGASAWARSSSRSRRASARGASSPSWRT